MARIRTVVADTEYDAECTENYGEPKRHPPPREP